MFSIVSNTPKQIERFDIMYKSIDMPKSVQTYGEHNVYQQVHRSNNANG